MKGMPNMGGAVKADVKCCVRQRERARRARILKRDRVKLRQGSLAEGPGRSSCPLRVLRFQPTKRRTRAKRSLIARQAFVWRIDFNSGGNMKMGLPGRSLWSLSFESLRHGGEGWPLGCL